VRAFSKGVITLPLNEAFARAHVEMGVPLSALGDAMKLAASRSDEPPLFKLERGQLTDPEFMAIMQAAISEVVGREVALDNYGDGVSAQPCSTENSNSS